MPFSYLGGRGLIRFVCWLVFNFHIHNTRNVLNLTGRCSPEGHLSVSAVCVYIYTQSIYLWEYTVQCRAWERVSACLSRQLSHLFWCALFHSGKDDCVLTLPCCSEKAGPCIPRRGRWCLPCRAGSVCEPAGAFPEHSNPPWCPAASSSGGRQCGAGPAALPAWSCATRSSCPSSSPALSWASLSSTWGQLLALGSLR